METQKRIEEMRNQENQNFKVENVYKEVQEQGENRKQL